MRTNLPTALRVLRRRRSWRQEDLGRRAGLARDTVSRVERGEVDGLTLATLTRLADAVGAALVVELRWQGADLDRLIDRAHASLQELAARRLADAGWFARPEVSFNHFGDRGRCDLAAWHPSSRTLLIVEVKSRLGDVQDTLGRLDVKVRLGSVIAGQLGWGRPARVVPALVLPDTRTSRRVLARHETLFRSFGLRGRAALTWLRAPAGWLSGMIWFERPDSDEGSVTGSQRVRNGRPAA